MKNLMIVGMLFASMSVFAQDTPKKENLPACCKSNKIAKAPAQQVNDKEKTVRAVKHQANGNSAHGKKVGHKVRVAAPGSPVSGKVEEKM
jgi:hypothetical protein